MRQYSSIDTTSNLDSQNPHKESGKEPWKNLPKIEDFDFSNFEWRTEALSDIYRYSNYKVSYYRSNLSTHSKRVFFLAKFLKSEIYNMFPGVDMLKILAMSLVHDDVEILIGDFQSVNRLKMTPEQIAIIDGNEEVAIGKISEQFPKEISGYSYQELLLEVFQKNTIEAQIVKYLDHIDGFCEALHEIYAWNECFTTSPETEYGQVPIPPDYYIPRFSNPEKYYPLISSAIGIRMPFVRNFERIDFELIAKNSSPHSAESIQTSSNYPLYDFWKNVIISSSCEEVASLLVVRSKKEIL